MIRLKNIEAKYGDDIVFTDLNLEIKDQSFYGIVGPSGVGKSTLLRLIAGLLEPAKGTIDINDASFFPNTKENRRKIATDIGYIFQDFALFLNLSVWDNMAVVQKIKDSKQIEKLLKQFDIYERKDAFPDQLSGGQKQRLAIARALILNPKILLIDEATSSLDAVLTKQFMDYMTKLNQSGITIILITHELDLVEKYCTDVFTLDNPLH